MYGSCLVYAFRAFLGAIMSYVLTIWNLIVFILYGVDKLKAKKSKWRISEFALILFALLMGGAGALLGMVVFNHKTSKAKFRFFIPVAFLFNATTLYFCGGYFIKITAFFENLY